MTTNLLSDFFISLSRLKERFKKCPGKDTLSTFLFGAREFLERWNAFKISLLGFFAGITVFSFYVSWFFYFVQLTSVSGIFLAAVSHTKKNPLCFTCTFFIKKQRRCSLTFLLHFLILFTYYCRSFNIMKFSGSWMLWLRRMRLVRFVLVSHTFLIRFSYQDTFLCTCVYMCVKYSRMHRKPRRRW